MTGGQDRAIEVARVLAAAPDRVWAALTEPSQLVAWYCEDAEVQPRRGGRYRAWWGEGVEGASTITVWEAPSRLLLTHVALTGPESRLAQPITEEFTLRAVTSGTDLRVTQCHIPDDPEWDAYYEAESHGWTIALTALAAHVEDTDAIARTEIAATAPLQGTVERTWSLLVGPAGLHLDGFGARDAFDVPAGPVGHLRGLLWSCRPPHSLMARVDEPGPAYLSANVDADAESVEVRWSCYGWQPAEIDTLREHLQPWLDDVTRRAADAVDRSD